MLRSLDFLQGIESCFREFQWDLKWFLTSYRNSSSKIVPGSVGTDKKVSSALIFFFCFFGALGNSLNRLRGLIKLILG